MHALMQAYLTRRKKDKVFAVYDLNIVLRWSGHWVEDDKKVASPCRLATPVQIVCCEHNLSACQWMQMCDAC